MASFAFRYASFFSWDSLVIFSFSFFFFIICLGWGDIKMYCLVVVMFLYLGWLGLL